MDTHASTKSAQAMRRHRPRALHAQAIRRQAHAPTRIGHASVHTHSRGALILARATRLLLTEEISQVNRNVGWDIVGRCSGPRTPASNVAEACLKPCVGRFAGRNFASWPTRGCSTLRSGARGYDQHGQWHDSELLCIRTLGAALQLAK